MYQFSQEERKAYETMPAPMAVYQYIDGKVVTVLITDGFCRLKAQERDFLCKSLDDSMFQMVHPDDAGRLAKVGLSFAKHESNYDMMYRSRAKAGEEYHLMHCSGYWKTMPNGEELAFLYYTDMTNNAERINFLWENYITNQKDQFFTDQLTGLPNMNYLNDFSEEKTNAIVRQGKTPVMIFVDVNGMQAYNTKYSYEAGNKLLISIAEALSAAFDDALVTRGDADHFVIIAVDEHAEERLQMASELVKKNAIGNLLGFQAGICRMTSGMSAVQALDHAKHALKTLHHDLTSVCAVYSAQTDEEYWKQQYVVENFDQALANGWIKIFYQGIMRTATGKTSSLEALARWIDPERGMISPAEFIPVLEKYHLLYKMDLYMVEQVCREIPLRTKENLQILPVSINFSGQDFDLPDLAERVMGIVDRHGVDHSDLIIEITEQALTKASDNLVKQTEIFRQNGFKVWVDDFGSGYSSLNVLSKYRFDLIKIDMEFMRNFNDEGGINKTLVNIIVETAHQLGLSTLSEGVETQEQLAFLKEIHCDLIQGYYYHKPESFASIAFRNQMHGSIAPRETPEEAAVFAQLYSEGIYKKEK